MESQYSLSPSLSFSTERSCSPTSELQNEKNEVAINISSDVYICNVEEKIKLDLYISGIYNLHNKNLSDKKDLIDCHNEEFF
jgi:hypothetical protein